MLKTVPRLRHKLCHNLYPSPHTIELGGYDASRITTGMVTHLVLVLFLLNTLKWLLLYVPRVYLSSSILAFVADIRPNNVTMFGCGKALAAVCCRRSRPGDADLGNGDCAAGFTMLLVTLHMNTARVFRCGSYKLVAGQVQLLLSLSPEILMARDPFSYYNLIGGLEPLALTCCKGISQLSTQYRK